MTTICKLRRDPDKCFRNNLLCRDCPNRLDAIAQANTLRRGMAIECGRRQQHCIEKEPRSACPVYCDKCLFSGTRNYCKDEMRHAYIHTTEMVIRHNLGEV